MPSLKLEPIRHLSLQDLGLGDLVAEASDPALVPPPTDASVLDENDAILGLVRRALDLGFAGVILSGPPGTGKSWYAQQLAVALTGDWETVRSVQFHPSYQYEDFVFGYKSNPNGVFVPTAKAFASLCRDAAANLDKTYVLVIDEISRSDVIRVFGEALTYLEVDKRDLSFETATGEDLIVPRNLVVLATMNPWDKGVDELDAALERRFAQVDLLPDRARLEQLLTSKGAEQPFLGKLLAFFDGLQQDANERIRLGHAYFLKCVDADTARSIWTLRLLPTLRRACSLDRATLVRLEQAWSEVVTAPPPDEVAGEAEGANPAGANQ